MKAHRHQPKAVGTGRLRGAWEVVGAGERSRGGSVVHPAGVGAGGVGVRVREVMGAQGGIGGGEIKAGIEGVEGEAEAEGGVPGRGEGVPAGGGAGVMGGRRVRRYISFFSKYSCSWLAFWCIKFGVLVQLDFSGFAGGGTLPSRVNGIEAETVGQTGWKPIATFIEKATLFEFTPRVILLTTGKTCIAGEQLRRSLNPSLSIRIGRG